MNKIIPFLFSISDLIVRFTLIFSIFYLLSYVLFVLEFFGGKNELINLNGIFEYNIYRQKISNDGLYFLLISLFYLLGLLQSACAFLVLKRRAIALVGYLLFGLMNSIFIFGYPLLGMILMILVVLPWLIVLFSFKNEDETEANLKQ